MVPPWQTSCRLRQAQPAAPEPVEGATSVRCYIKLRNGSKVASEAELDAYGVRVGVCVVESVVGRDRAVEPLQFEGYFSERGVV